MNNSTPARRGFSLFRRDRDETESEKSKPERAGRRARARVDRPRAVLFTSRGVEIAEGEGLRITRLIGGPGLDMLDPFLLVDWFTTDATWRQQVGFPEHPHAGIETVTYVLSGAMKHKDNRDNESVVEAGGVQWVSSGAGIVHSEIAEERDEAAVGLSALDQPARQPEAEGASLSRFPRG